MKRLARLDRADAGVLELLRQPVLQGPEHALRAPARFRRVGRDVLDAEMTKRSSDLGRPILVDFLTGLRGMEVVAAAVAIQARRQPLLRHHPKQPAEARGGAFPLRPKRRKS